jgi:hypothetical protein
MKRIVMAVGVIVLMPLLMGAGGSAPGIPAASKIAGSTFQANVVIDAHEPGATTTAKQASIRIYQAANTAAAMFDIPLLGFPFLAGCDLSRTDTRFFRVTLISWIPEAVLNQLFTELGTGRNASMEPIVTRIENDACTSDPANPTTADGSLPGFLSFQATIRFLVPK